MKRFSLREARDMRGMTQQALAERADMEQSHISALENGRKQQPEIQTMRKLAEALGMDAFLSAKDGLVFEERAS